MNIDQIMFQTFKFSKPIEMEEAKFGHGVIASNRRTIVQAEKGLSTDVMTFVWAKAKLAEINPLIITLPAPEDSTEDEVELYKLFDFLCEPIKEAWTWKTVRRYAPSLYRRYIQKLAESVNQPKAEIIANWMDILNAYCVLQEEGVLKVSLVVERSLQEYVDAVAEFSRMEPDASLYEELAYRLGGPNGIKRTAITCLNISALEDVMRSPAKGRG